ncbi:MAG: prepilin-type N-terminal cleavage/methylation domain-containing protein [Firmicutes bacterium]|nr:prepilin-type N-terminal cleavage/methylation domain-containing protein [Bacillota bacterium]MCL5038951.1 prepilin-type N-terminal cleavage/methylation domain-containing protein [Bacillota bacterium]
MSRVWCGFRSLVSGPGLQRGSAGYSLVEVLVAMAILSLALLPLFSAFLVGARNIYSTGPYVEANSLLRQAVEEIKATPFQVLTAGDYTHDNYAGSSFTLKYTVSDVTAMPDRQGKIAMKKISLSLERGGQVYARAEFTVYRTRI